MNQTDNPFNDEHFSLFAISFVWPSGTCNLSESFPDIGNNAPTDAQKENIENVFFVRFVDKVFVENIGGSPELFVDYYDHADLEIDNSGHFTGKRTIYYLDKTEVETTTYSAAVQTVNSCTLKNANGQIVPVYYCTKKTGNATLNDVCNHGDDAYTNAVALDSIETRCYVDNGAPIGSTQYEYTSKFGHQRFSKDAYSALFNFDLLLTPSTRDVTTKILATGETTTLYNQSATGLPDLTSTGATTVLDHHSFVDAYNFCPDHSGLDFHIGGNISAKIDFKFDPVTVYLGAKKQLTGKDLGEGEFSFVLIDRNGGISDGKILQTVSYDADGVIRFAPLNFSQAKTYYYTIEEVVPDPGAPGIVYDKSKVNVSIEVTGSSAESNMAAKIYYNGTEYTNMNNLPVFTNRFETNLTIQKKVVGKALDSDEIYTLTIRRMDGASINWNGLRAEKVKIDSNEKATIPIYGSEYETVLDISDNERITIFGLPIGEYSIQEWKTPVTPEYTWVEKNWGNQPEDPLWSNPLDPNHTNGWWYYAGVVELTATAPNATQLITNTFCQLAVTKRVEGNSAPADTTPYTVKVTSDGSVKWDKVQASSSIPNKTVPLTVNNGVSFTLVKDETVTLVGLPAGKYRVEETTLDGVASVTYSPNGGVITTNAEHYQDAVVITNTFPTGYELPATGGPGTGRYTLGGFTMAAGAALWLCYRRKRRREDG